LKNLASEDMLIIAAKAPIDKRSPGVLGVDKKEKL
jgi:hypothetical protein